MSKEAKAPASPTKDWFVRESCPPTVTSLISGWWLSSFTIGSELVITRISLNFLMERARKRAVVLASRNRVSPGFTKPAAEAAIFVFSGRFMFCRISAEISPKLLSFGTAPPWVLIICPSCSSSIRSRRTVSSVTPPSRARLETVAIPFWLMVSKKSFLRSIASTAATSLLPVDSKCWKALEKGLARDTSTAPHGVRQ